MPVTEFDRILTETTPLGPLLSCRVKTMLTAYDFIQIVVVDPASLLLASTPPLINWRTRVGGRGESWRDADTEMWIPVPFGCELPEDAAFLQACKEHWIAMRRVNRMCWWHEHVEKDPTTKNVAQA